MCEVRGTGERAGLFFFVVLLFDLKPSGRGTPAVRRREFMNDHDVCWRKLLVYEKRNSGNELDTATLNLGSLNIPTYYKSSKDFSVWSSCIWEGPLSFRQF